MAWSVYRLIMLQSTTQTMSSISLKGFIGQHFDVAKNNGKTIGKKCNYCDKVLKAEHNMRFLSHLRGCTKTSDSLKKECKNYEEANKVEVDNEGGEATTSNNKRKALKWVDSVSEQEKDSIDMAITEYIITTGAPFRSVDCAAFKKNF